MSDTPIIETEIIQAAYADKVKDAFIVFADNLAVGQGEKSCKDRFLRSLMLVKKARDMAIEAMGAEAAVEPPVPGPETAKTNEGATDSLSAQDRALIDAAVGGTTGVAAPPVPGGPLRLR